MRVAFVTPRYGAGISSGAEHACRLLAEHLAPRHDVEVLTTTALDEHSWRPDGQEGSDRVRGVLVRRFAVGASHEREPLAAHTARLLQQPRSRNEELAWVRHLGPQTPGLIEHLKRQHKAYDAIVFFSLVHWTTVHGLEIAPERSLVVPFLQLQPALRFALWRDVLTSARGIGLMAPAERALLRTYLGVNARHEETIGIGIDPPHRTSYPRHQEDPADNAPVDDVLPPPEPIEVDEEESQDQERSLPFRRRHRLHGRLALYAGRVATDNGCEEMLEYFDAYAQQDADLSLALMGVKLFPPPASPQVRLAGVLADRERMSAYQAADVTIAPEYDDLLAESVLESLAAGTPALVSARNRAAVELCRRSGGGLYYGNQEEFVEGLRVLMTQPRLRQQMGRCGRDYVRQNHRWEGVLGRLERLVMMARGR